jgi:hypothetical protein
MIDNLPFKPRTVILAPKYDLKKSTDHAIYQVVNIYVEKTDILKGLTTSNDYYNNFIYKGKHIPTKLTIDKDLSKSKWALKFKTDYLMKRLYSEDKKFENSRRLNGKYYRDKIKDRQEIDLPSVRVMPNKISVIEGNHRVVAFSDSGFDTVVAETEFDYHKAFREYPNYKFVDRW